MRLSLYMFPLAPLLLYNTHVIYLFPVEPKTMCVLQDVEGLADQLPALIEGRRTTLAAKKAQMTELEKAGLTYASEHWREGKYMYLIYPTHDGQRPRKYVGTDPQKVAAARAGIARAQEFDRLADETRKIEAGLQQGLFRLREAVAFLKGRGGYAW